MLSRLIFWPWFAGLMTLVCGLFAARKSFSAAEGLEKVIVFGPIFFSVPLAVFGAEHFSNSRSISQIVPPWMPARMFWTCFVGFALISAGLSIAPRINHARISAMLVGIMFICFVLMIHIPNVAVNPNNRIVWAVALRDLAFAGGAFALAATLKKPIRIVARVLVAEPLFLCGRTLPASGICARRSPRKGNTGVGPDARFLGLPDGGRSTHLRGDHAGEP